MTHFQRISYLIVLGSVILGGCANPAKNIKTVTDDLAIKPSDRSARSVVLASHQVSETNTDSEQNSEFVQPSNTATRLVRESLIDLEIQARRSNPMLKELAQQYQAARAKARYVDELPDPTLGVNVFGHPIETAAGSQRANLTVAQMLPWLERLDAQAQEACFQAMAIGQMHAAEELKLIGDIRALWYRLYVIEKQVEINTANQELLKSLIDVANSRVATGKASQGDVLIGTLEYSKIEETLVGLRQQRVAVKAEINRLAGREASTPITSPQELEARLPEWDYSLLRDLAWNNQPEIETARIRTQATRWGVEVARLKRRPDFTVSASWFAIDDNRPASSIVDVGEDAWSIGAMMSLPIRHEKYDAIEQEARWKHAASHSSVQQVMQRYDSLLLDLWERAKAAEETANLYENTIIPDAKRTLNADQESYSNGEVEFDRVVQDFRNLLTLELGRHRSIGQLATAIARIQQAIGTELTVSSTESTNENQLSNESMDGELPPDPLSSNEIEAN